MTRRGLALLVPPLLLAAGIVAWRLTATAPEPQPESNFARASAAYEQLAAAQLELGLTPFPSTPAALDAARARISLPGAAWQAGTASNGGQSWQLGGALTLLCSADGRLEQTLYSLPAAGQLAPAELGGALATLAALDRTQQRPLSLGADNAQLSEAPFYLDYNADGYSWRFTPQFSAGGCTGIAVVESPAPASRPAGK